MRWRAPGIRRRPISVPADSVTAGAAPVVRPRARNGPVHDPDDGDAGLGQTRPSISATCSSPRRWIWQLLFPRLRRGRHFRRIGLYRCARSTITQKMPHVLTMNPVKQMIARQRLPEAIVEGTLQRHAWDGTSMEGQFTPFEYPLPGFSRVHMIYRYGEHEFRHHRPVDTLPRLLPSSLRRDGGQPVDLVRRGCPLRRHHLAGLYVFRALGYQRSGQLPGYIHHNQFQVNHRMITLQHKCIEPLGEVEVGLPDFPGHPDAIGPRRQCSPKGVVSSTGASEFSSRARCCRARRLEGVRQEGLFRCPCPARNLRDPVAYRWYVEGRQKDTPEPNPLPSQFNEQFGMGLETQTGKIEFVSSSLRRLTSTIPTKNGRH